jgi:LysM repeat protein
LAICAVAVVFVIGGSLGGDDSDGGTPDVATVTDRATSTATTPERPERTTYTIKAGDTLGAIAESTGIPVETLQELNPELDPQALIAGQKIQLR